LTAVHSAGQKTFMPRKLSYATSTKALFKEIAFSLAQLKAYGITARFVGDAETFLVRWHEINRLELEFIATDVTAQAHIERVDGEIDPVVEETVAKLLLEVKNDRRNPFYTRFLGTWRPSELTRPILGPELETVRVWPASIQAAPLESLKPIGPRLEELVGEADAALGERNENWRRWDDFDKTGARHLFVDDLNRFRATLHADLTKLANSAEGRTLPPGFADSFFVRGQRKGVASQELSLPELKAQLAELQTQIDLLEKEQRERELAAAQRAADETRATELRRELEQIEARLSK
jgi:hypothetical protein